MNAPLSRIFWSLQSGIVVSARDGFHRRGKGIARDEFGVLNGIGIIVLLIGIGFTLSAAVSYSCRTALDWCNHWPPATVEKRRHHDETPPGLRVSIHEQPGSDCAGHRRFRD
jgi:hypothetical protein